MRVDKIVFVCLLLGRLQAQEASVSLAFSGGSNYSLTERSDFRRYDNGKYVGLVSREVRSFITAEESGGARYYDGLFYVAEKTKRDARAVDAGIHDAVHSEFKITKDGKLVMLEDNGYPSFRNFPSFPLERVRIGDSWTGKGERAFDPLNKGIITKMPVLVQYTYTGTGELDGEPVHILKAKWATRYGKLYRDPDGDGALENAQGSHDAMIYVSARTGYALLVRDTVDEYFEYAGGQRVQLKGTIALFTKYPPTVDKGKLLPSLQRAIAVAERTGGGAVPADSEGLAGFGGGRKAEADDGGFAGGKKKNATAGTAGGLVRTDTGAKSGADAERSEGAGKPQTNRADNGRGGKNAAAGTTGGLARTDTGVKSDADAERSEGTGKPQTNRADNGRGGKSTPTETAGSSLVRTADGKVLGGDSLSVENTASGLRLTMQNLRFKPDSAELLASEAARLDAIADVLRQAPDSQFLVEGHTASVGYPAGELKLSAERARAVAAALASRGIDADKFICRGSGAAKPIADNTTPEGKAKNRRVEITILE